MRIDIITVLPEMIEGFIHESILARAQKKGLAEIHLHNLRDYTLDKWRRVDDYPYGGFAGMVMQIEPIDRCISALKAERDYDEVIFTSPDGEPFNQHVANDLSLKENIIILCGHYKGVDQRVRDHLITREISVGDSTVSKMISWQLPSIRDPQIIKVGRSPTSCSPATRPKSSNGKWTRPCAAPENCVPTCWETKKSNY